MSAVGGRCQPITKCKLVYWIHNSEISYRKKIDKDVLFASPLDITLGVKQFRERQADSNN